MKLKFLFQGTPFRSQDAILVIFVFASLSIAQEAGPHASTVDRANSVEGQTTIDGSLKQLNDLNASKSEDEHIVDVTIANSIMSSPNADEIYANLVGLSEYDRQRPNATAEERDKFAENLSQYISEVKQSQASDSSYLDAFALTADVGAKVDMTGIVDPSAGVRASVDLLKVARRFSSQMATGFRGMRINETIGTDRIATVKPASAEEVTAAVSSARKKPAEFQAFTTKNKLPFKNKGDSYEKFATVHGGAAFNKLVLGKHAETSESLNQMKINLSSIKKDVSDIKDDVTSILTQVENINSSLMAEQNASYIDSKIRKEYGQLKFTVNFLQAITRDMRPEVKAAVLTASYLVEVNELAIRHALANKFLLDNPGQKIAGFSADDLKNGITSLGVNLAFKLFTLFGGGGPSEMQIILAEVKKLQEEVKHLKGASVSRLNQIDASLNYFARETRERFDIIEKMMDRLLEDNRRADAKGEKREHDSKRKSSEANLSARGRTHRALKEQADAALVSFQNPTDSHFLWTKDNSDAYRNGAGSPLLPGSSTATVDGLASVGLAKQGAGIVPEFTSWIPDASTTEPLPYNLDSFEGHLNIGYRDHLQSFSEVEGPFSSYGETSAAALIRFRHLIDGKSTASDIKKLGLPGSPGAYVVAQPDLLSSRIHAVVAGIARYKEAAEAHSADEHATAPNACSDLTESLLNALKTITALDQVLPKDREGRPDIIPLMVLAKDYLSNLRAFHQHILKTKKQNAPLAFSTEQARNWGKDQLEKLLTRENGKTGVASCNNQTFNPSADASNNHYSVLPSETFERLGFPREKWASVIPDEVLYTALTSGGELTLCYEWIAQPANQRFSREDSNLRIDSDAFVGVKLKFLLKPGEAGWNALESSKEFSRERIAIQTDKEYLVLGERSALSPVPIPNWTSESRQMIYGPTNYKADISDSVTQHREASSFFSEIIRETPFGNQWRPLGWAKSAKETPAEFEKQISNLLDRLTNPNLADPVTKDWALNLADTLFSNNRAKQLNVLSEPERKLPNGTYAKSYQQVPALQIGDSNDARKKAVLSGYVWANEREIADKKMNASKTAFRQAGSEASTLLKSLEGSRKLLKNVLRLAYQDKLPDKLSAQLDSLPSEESIMTMEEQLQSSFYSLSESSFVQHEKTLINLIHSISSREMADLHRESTNLEKTVDIGMKLLNHLKADGDKAFEKDCNNPKLKPGLDEVRRLYANLTSKNGVPSHRLMSHGFFHTQNEQSKFADAVNRAIDQGVDANFLFETALNRLKEQKAAASGSRTGFSAPKVFEEEARRILPREQTKFSSLSDLFAKGARLFGHRPPSNVRSFELPPPPLLNLPTRPLGEIRESLQHQLSKLIGSQLSRFSPEQRKVLSAWGIDGKLNFEGMLANYSDRELAHLSQVLNDWEMVTAELSAPRSIEEARLKLEAYAKDPNRIQRVESGINSLTVELLLEQFLSKDKQKLGHGLLALRQDGKFRNIAASEINEITKELTEGFKETSKHKVRKTTERAFTALAERLEISPSHKQRSDLQYLVGNIAARHDKLEISTIRELDAFISRMPETLLNAWHQYFRTDHRRLLRNRDAGIRNFIRLVQLSNRFNSSLGNPIGASLAHPALADDIVVKHLDAAVTQFENNQKNNSGGKDQKGASEGVSDLERRFSPETIQSAQNYELALAKLIPSSSNDPEYAPRGVFIGLDTSSLKDKQTNLASYLKNPRDLNRKAIEPDLNILKSANYDGAPSRTWADPDGRFKTLAKLKAMGPQLREAWELTKTYLNETRSFRDRINMMIGGNQLSRTELAVLARLEEVLDKSARRLEESIKTIEATLDKQSKFSTAALIQIAENTKPEIEFRDVPHFARVNAAEATTHDFVGINPQQYKEVAKSARDLAEVAFDRAKNRAGAYLPNLVLSEIGKK
jgi:hypothetical protein